MTAFDQLPHALAVTLAALVLAQRAFVPLELERSQSVQDLLDVSGTERSRSVSSIRSTRVPPSAWREASCRVPCGRRRCGVLPWATGQSEGEVARDY